MKLTDGQDNPHTQTHSRRGMAIAVIIVVLAVLALVVAGAVRPAAQEADVASLRVQTIRAFYAAESGVSVLIGSVKSGTERPITGDVIAWGTQSVEFESVSADSVTLVGRSGFAQRRISLDLE